MDRRTFAKNTLILGAGSCLLGLQGACKASKETSSLQTPKYDDIKKVFFKHGPCSHALYYLLNRDFGHIKPEEQFASDPLAGGIMQRGYQCGMLWGASLAVGAEAFRRFDDPGQAIAASIETSRLLVHSFKQKAKSVHCSEITKCNFQSKLGMVKFMLSGKPVSCVRLADKWGNEAIEIANKGMETVPANLPSKVQSCASMVAKNMGATPEEAITVSGFAGGIGLCGGTCGALCSAIWNNSLSWCRKNPGESAYGSPEAEKILESFLNASKGEFDCTKICGRKINTLQSHTEYLEKGGCGEIIKVLSNFG